MNYNQEEKATYEAFLNQNSLWSFGVTNFNFKDFLFFIKILISTATCEILTHKFANILSNATCMHGTWCTLIYVQS